LVLGPKTGASKACGTPVARTHGEVLSA
jgi:hypothetical protein